MADAEMILPVVKYGHPALRQKGARIESIDAGINRLIDDMFETMYAARGVGLAAQQIGQALQLTVIDVTGITDRPSTLEMDGRAIDPASRMPLVLVNPEIKPGGAQAPGPEGCLSFPEMFADITRPEWVDVAAQDREGKPIRFRAGGLLGRAVQHEVDHLNGILFIDRMKREDKENLREELDLLQASTRAQLKK